MGTLADKLQYLKDTKDAIMNAIISKGVEVSNTDTFRSYADKISSINSEIKESTFTGYIAQDGSTNVIPTILQSYYDTKFKGLMRINDSPHDRRKFILDSTFNSGTDETLEFFIHYIHNLSLSSSTGLISFGSKHWKSCYMGTHYKSTDESRFFWALGNNGSSWMYNEEPFPSFNLAHHPEVYIKFIITPSTVSLTTYDKDKVTVLGEKTVDMDTTSIDNKIMLFNNWDLYDDGGAYANNGTIDLSDSYIKINNVVVQGILK